MSAGDPVEFFSFGGEKFKAAPLPDVSGTKIDPRLHLSFFRDAPPIKALGAKEMKIPVAPLEMEATATFVVTDELFQRCLHEPSPGEVIGGLIEAGLVEPEVFRTPVDAELIESLERRVERLRAISDGHLRGKLKLEEKLHEERARSKRLEDFARRLLREALYSNGLTVGCKICGMTVRTDDPDPQEHRARCSFVGDIRETYRDLWGWTP